MNVCFSNGWIVAPDGRLLIYYASSLNRSLEERTINIDFRSFQMYDNLSKGKRLQMVRMSAVPCRN